jgi:hypothetical protein
MAKGYEVFRALGGRAPCDLIAMKHGEFSRVEVKTESHAWAYGIKRNLGKFDVAAVVAKDHRSITYHSAFEIIGQNGTIKCGTTAAGEIGK